MTPLTYLPLLLLSRSDHRPRRSKVPTARLLALRSGESVVMVTHPSRLLTLPKYLVTLGLYGIWRKRHTYVVTDQRLMIGRGVVSRREWTIPMRQIEGVSFVRKGAGASCLVEATSRGGRGITDAVGPLTPRQARRMVSAIESHI